MLKHYRFSIIKSNEILLQDVVYALAHATGKTGRFTLIERWRNNERLLAPQEHPLKVSVIPVGARTTIIVSQSLALRKSEN